MSFLMSALLAALLLPHFAGAQAPYDPSSAQTPYDPTHPFWLSREKQAHVANCVVDIGIAMTVLGKAGILINAAADNCDQPGDGPGKGAACTAAVSGVIASFGWAATFISASAAECRSTLQIVDEHAVLQEGCAADVAVTVATLSVLVNSGAIIKDTCPGPRGADKNTQAKDESFDDRRRLEASTVDAAGRRGLEELGNNRSLALEKIREAARKLEGHGFNGPAQQKGKTKKNDVEQVPLSRTAAQNAACAFNVAQFTFLSARAGLMINYAVEDCSAQALFHGGDINKAKCITDVGRTIGAFGYAASGIAFAVAGCPSVLNNLDPKCGAAIANIVAAVAELVGNSADFANTCAVLSEGGAKEKADEEKIKEDVFDPVRRLSAGANATSPERTFV